MKWVNNIFLIFLFVMYVIYEICFVRIWCVRNIGKNKLLDGFLCNMYNVFLDLFYKFLNFLFVWRSYYVFFNKNFVVFKVFLDKNLIFYFLDYM